MFSEDLLTEEAIYDACRIIEIEQKINRDNLVYKTGDQKKGKTYDFQKFKARISFQRGIHNDELTLEDELEEQIKFKNKINKFKESAKPNFSTKSKKSL